MAGEKIIKHKTLNKQEVKSIIIKKAESSISRGVIPVFGKLYEAIAYYQENEKLAGMLKLWKTVCLSLECWIFSMCPTNHPTSKEALYRKDLS